MSYLIAKPHKLGGQGYLIVSKALGNVFGASFNATPFETLEQAVAELTGPLTYVVSSATLKPLGSHLSIRAIQEANERVGNHFFDKGTLRFFSSRVGADVFQGTGGIYFVTSERGPDGRRAYTVRTFNEVTGHVKTVGGFQEFATGAQAKREAKALAKGLDTETCDECGKRIPPFGELVNEFHALSCSLNSKNVVAKASI